MKASGKNVFRAAASAILVVAMLIIGLASTATAEKKKKETAAASPAVDITKLVWPPPPDVTRIKYVSSARGEDDLKGTTAKKKKSSWMDRMAGVSLPDEQGKPRLLRPYGVVADSKGLIYVADAGQGMIFVFDVDKKAISYRAANMLASPAGMAIDDTDRLFVVDAIQHQVFAFRPDGTFEAAFGGDRLIRPVGAAVDNENRFLYIVDSFANRIVVFDVDTYRFLRAFGKESDPQQLPGTFSAPTNIAVDSEGNVYVADTFNMRVQVFNADGEFVTMWGKPGSSAGNFMRPKGIAVDRDDHIYVVDTEFNNVQVFDRDGRLLMYFGDRGQEPGSFMLATGIFVDSFNRVLVTEQWNGRLQVFRYVTDKEAAPEYEKLAKAREAQNASVNKPAVIK